MRLIDCFVSSLAYTLDVISDADEGQHRDFDSVHAHIISQLNSLNGLANDGGYTDKQYRQALFSAVAFIDEKIVSSAWEGKKQWMKSLLQKYYFDTSNAGVEFYDYLDKLNPFNPAEIDIREVYFYCMSLGFEGKFYGKGVKSALETIKLDNYKLLTEEQDFTEEVLFPNAFAKKKSEGKVNVAKNYAALIYGGPILLLLTSFFYFKKELLDLANILVISV